MLEYALWAAVLCAVIGAFSGSRTAWALLASFGFGMAINTAGLQFSPALWAGFDALVALFIMARLDGRRDVIILALYLPIFGFYLADEYTRYVAVTCIVIAQMLLTFPALRFWHRVKKTPLPDFNNPFDLRQTAQCYQPPTQ